MPPLVYGGALVVWPGIPFPNLDGRIHQSTVFALDHRGLGATAGAHNPLDILVIGCQDGLQLRRERCQASLWIILQPHALVLECACIHAVLEKESMMRAFRRDLYSFIFYATKYLPEVH
jgi:hypothetical protein